MRVLGLDGYKSGWVVIEIDGDDKRLFSIKALDELSTASFDRMAIDMPIGLPKRGYRDCDKAARDILNRHRSRVFLGARRSVINRKWKSAVEINKVLHADDEPGISLQLWHLRSKIQEVDRFVRSHPDRKIIETHPELVFWRLNGERLLDGSKKTAGGIAQRAKILRVRGFRDIEKWLQAERPKYAKRDDVLDACAAAIAACDFSTTRVLPPGHVPHDDCGLPMQIWY